MRSQPGYLQVPRPNFWYCWWPATKLFKACSLELIRKFRFKSLRRKFCGWFALVSKLLRLKFISSRRKFMMEFKNWLMQFSSFNSFFSSQFPLISLIFSSFSSLFESLSLLLESFRFNFEFISVSNKSPDCPFVASLECVLWAISSVAAAAFGWWKSVQCAERSGKKKKKKIYVRGGTLGKI